MIDKLRYRTVMVLSGFFEMQLPEKMYIIVIKLHCVQINNVVAIKSKCKYFF